MGVRRLDIQEANRQLTESVLGGETLSAPTLQILNRAGARGSWGTGQNASGERSSSLS